eukprot:6211831-Pleurochrysis_carterae.AAC.1
MAASGAGGIFGFLRTQAPSRRACASLSLALAHPTLRDARTHGYADKHKCWEVTALASCALDWQSL